MGALVPVVVAFATMLVVAWLNLGRRQDMPREADLGDGSGFWDTAGSRDPADVSSGLSSSGLSVSGLFSLSFVQRRIDALAAELDELDRDDDRFAKAFHLTAARTAYRALKADEQRLRAQIASCPAASLEFDLGETSGPTAAGQREILEL